MSLRVGCACGAEFNAKPELAGKTVKCPTCGGSFKIPKPQAPSPSIRVKCRCGSTFNAKSALAGKRVKCPSCERILTVPNPFSTAARIRVACTCGHAFKAKGDLAGRRVKCPSCGDPILVPAKEVVAKPPDDLEDPLGLGADAPDPYFADGGIAGAVAGFDPLKAPAARPALPKSRPARRIAGRSRQRDAASVLVIIAGVVAVCYGGLLTLRNALSLLSAVASTVTSAWEGDTLSIISAFDLFYIGLSIWLTKSGIDILRNESREDALWDAAKASMVYLAFGLLGLLALTCVFAFASFLPFGLGAILGGLSLFGGVLLIIYMLPPAFILYAQRSQETGEYGLRNPVAVGGGVVLGLGVLVLGTLLVAGVGSLANSSPGRRHGTMFGPDKDAPLVMSDTFEVDVPAGKSIEIRAAAARAPWENCICIYNEDRKEVMSQVSNYSYYNRPREDEYISNHEDATTYTVTGWTKGRPPHGRGKWRSATMKVLAESDDKIQIAYEDGANSDFRDLVISVWIR